MAVLFISADYLIESTTIDENVDTKYLTRAIIKAQDIALQELLGTDLLNELKDQVENSTLTAANTTLLNTFVLPFLAMQAASEAVILATLKFRNKGVVTMNSEDAIVGTQAQWQTLLDYYKNEAQFNGERMRKYLLDNSSTFPLYLNGNTESWKIRPTRTAYQTGLFLGRQRKPINWNNQTSLYNESWYDNGYCCYR